MRIAERRQGGNSILLFSNLANTSPSNSNVLLNVVPELQALILSFMSFADVCNIRLSCKAFYSMINQHSSPITRNILAKDDCLRKAHTLYRGVNLSSLDYLFSLSHRVYVAKNLARYLATSHIIFAFNLREYDTIESGPYWGHFVAMVQNIWPHLMILGHFLESFRADLIQIVQRQDIKSSHVSQVASTWRSQAILSSQYSSRHIHETAALCRFLLMHTSRRLRPVSYATSFERTLRGWTRDAATWQQCVSLLILGGLDSVKRLVWIPSYSRRMKTLEVELRPWVDGSGRELTSCTSTLTSLQPVPRRILPPLDQEITEQIIRIQPAFLELLDLPLIALSTGLRIGSNEFIPMLTRFDVFSFGTYLTSNEVESNFDLVEADH